MTINVSHLPHCAKRLQINFTNLGDPALTEYWASVIVADFCDDEALTVFGGFDFDDMSAENGAKLLERLEECIRQKKHKVSLIEVPAGLVAMLGARGIKTSMLKGDDDWWLAAETLFPGHTKRKGGLAALHAQILRIPKKQRRSLADANLRHINPEWLSNAPSHQHKLQGAA